MNFFGHAVVAWRLVPSAPYMLGAMLPDFATMANGRLVAVHEPEVASGVVLHHETDGVFHRSQRFAGLCAGAVADLTRRGVLRGGARAAAHIGTELFLDATWPPDDALARAFREALDVFAEDALGRHCEWDSEGTQARVERVRTRLVSAGIPARRGETEFVAARIEGILAARPKLALGDGHEQALRDGLALLRERVNEVAEALREEVVRGVQEKRAH